MANGTIAFDTLQTSGQITGTAKSLDTDYVVNGAVKSWARINGTGSGVPANQSFNVGSTTDSGTGDYEVAYSNNFSDGEYCITLGDSNNADVASATHTRCNTSSASGLGLQVYYNGALADATNVFYQVTGDLA
jgi:hypothetical protein